MHAARTEFVRLRRSNFRFLRRHAFTVFVMVRLSGLVDARGQAIYHLGQLGLAWLLAFAAVIAASGCIYLFAIGLDCSAVLVSADKAGILLI